MNNNRPKFKTSLSWKEKMLILISTLSIVVIWIYLYTMWNNIPGIVPIHFGFSGSPDRFGNKNSLLSIPIIASIMNILLVVLSKMPNYFNYPVGVTEENAEALYKIGKQLILILNMEISLMFLMLIWEDIQTAIGGSSGLGIEITGVAIFVILGTVIYETIRMKKIKN